MECRVGYSRLAFQSRILRGADWLPASSSVRAPKPSSTGRYLIKFHQPQVRVQVATPSKLSPAKSSSTKVEIEGPSTNLSVIFQRLQRVRLPEVWTAMYAGLSMQTCMHRSRKRAADPAHLMVIEP